MSACPVDNFDNVIESLKFLSSRQALADLANFHTFATEKYNLSGKKWDKTIKSLVKKNFLKVIEENNLFFVKRL